ncbi:tRNA (adenosine(37)-N6)-dimethylallyltransferase MiaA [Nitratifractor sp.]
MNPSNAHSTVTIALIGTTASGKTALALDLARRHGGVILSLDSLALYREIDIASAKPTPTERGSVPHFGIDLVAPDEPFDVIRFAQEARHAFAAAREQGVPLWIVGGSGFYLKILLEGISPLPPIDEATRRRVGKEMEDLRAAYRKLETLDPAWARKVSPTDRYRIEKALTILEATGEGPSSYFRSHPPQPIFESRVPLFEIEWDRHVLRERIAQRTEAMLESGLIDEVCGLEHRYGRAPVSMKAIGIREVLDYLDGRYDRTTLREKIVTDTARLAKRQRTFNRSQFQDVVRGEVEAIRDAIEAYLA